MNPAAPPVPPLLACLSEEHRHMAALAALLERRARQSAPLKRSDYSLMRDVVGYLHDYPDAVHHPTENLLFDRLRRRRPGLSGSLDGLQREHATLKRETAELLQGLDRAAAAPADAREAELRNTVRAVVRRQRRHMQRENRTVWPAAVETLQPADWKALARRIRLHEDPVFGQRVDRAHRTLYEYLLDFEHALPARMAARGIGAQERLIDVLGVIEHGRSEGARVMADAFGALRHGVLAALNPEGESGAPPRLARVPLRLGGLLGRTTWNTGWALLDITAATGHRVCRSLLTRRIE